MNMIDRFFTWLLGRLEEARYERDSRVAVELQRQRDRRRSDDAHKGRKTTERGGI